MGLFYCAGRVQPAVSVLTDADNGRHELNALKAEMLPVASNQPGVIDEEAGGKFMNSRPAPFQTLLGFEILNYLCPIHTPSIRSLGIT